MYAEGRRPSYLKCALVTNRSRRPPRPPPTACTHTGWAATRPLARQRQSAVGLHLRNPSLMDYYSLLVDRSPTVDSRRLRDSKSAVYSTRVSNSSARYNGAVLCRHLYVHKNSKLELDPLGLAVEFLSATSIEPAWSTGQFFATIHCMYGHHNLFSDTKLIHRC